MSTSQREQAGLNTRCATIGNTTGVPHFWFQQTGLNGEPVDVLVVRATFDFGLGGAVMKLAQNQQAIVLGDLFDGVKERDVMRAVVVDDGDLLLYKPGTDVLVTGSASAPHGIAARQWTAGIRVGTLKKALRLHGPRQFRKHLLGWRLDTAQPVTKVALDYRLAYGGCIDIPSELTGDGDPDTVKHEGNPAGCGWLPGSAAYAHLPKRARAYVRESIARIKELAAPQIEDPLEAVRSPYAGVSPQGLSAIARWWEPRVSLQGKYDAAWRAARYPLLPKEFTFRYFQCASAGLVATPHLQGDETVTLLGLLPERRDMTLPGWKIIAVATHASGEITVSLPLLDTLRFDLSREEASMVWRIHYDHDDPVIDVAIAATTQLIVTKEAAPGSAGDNKESL